MKYEIIKLGTDYLIKNNISLLFSLLLLLNYTIGTTYYY